MLPKAMLSLPQAFDDGHTSARALTVSFPAALVPMRLFIPLWRECFEHCKYRQAFDRIRRASFELSRVKRIAGGVAFAGSPWGVENILSFSSYVSPRN